MRWPFTKRPEPTPSDAARILAAARGQNYREMKRAMANQMRADMRAKSKADLPPIDWNSL